MYPAHVRALSAHLMLVLTSPVSIAQYLLSLCTYIAYLLTCLTHALPRCLPTPTEEADGNGYGAITGRGGGSLEAAAQSER